MNQEIDLLDKEIKSGTQLSRPVFLTVLCILTFVGAGVGVISSIYSMSTLGQLEESMALMNNTFTDSGIPFDFGDSYKWLKISYVLNLFGAILCLVGALIMWNFKKIGFYFYIVGQVAPLIGGFLTMNSMLKGSLVGFGMIAMIFSMIFPIAFIIMYGLNLKHMK